MGMYINPPASKYPTKEVWLIKQLQDQTIREIGVEDFVGLNWANLNEENLIPLVLIDNGAFTSLAVCYSAQELGYWQQNANTERRRVFYVLGKKDICLEYAS